MLTQERLKAAFRMFDIDGSGFISPLEIRDSLSDAEHLVSEHIIKNIFNAVDSNIDGQISFEEFMNFMHKTDW